jgi:hypothetical protein
MVKELSQSSHIFHYIILQLSDLGHFYITEVRRGCYSCVRRYKVSINITVTHLSIASAGQFITYP